MNTQATYCLSCADALLALHINKVHQRLQAVSDERNILASLTEIMPDYQLGPPGKKKTGERGAGELGSSLFNESLKETSKSPLSVYVSIELGWVKKKEGAQSSVRKKPRSAICNHPTSCPPHPKNSSKLGEKKNLACVLFIYFFPFRAKSTRTVLSHVPSPAPVPFSHISALQIVSVLPLQRAQM